MINLVWTFIKTFFRNPRAVVMAVFVPGVLFVALAFAESRSIIQFAEVSGSYQNFVLAGMITFATIQLCLHTTAYNLIDLKRLKVLKRMALTPIRVREFLTAQALARFVIAFIQAVALIIFGVVLFGVNLTTNLVWLPLVVLLGSMVAVGFGFFVAAVALDYEDASPYATVIAIGLNFVGDTFFPASSLPDTLNKLSMYLPLRPFSELLRFSIFEEATPHLFQNLIVLVVWLVVISFISWSLFAKKAYR